MARKQWVPNVSVIQRFYFSYSEVISVKFLVEIYSISNIHLARFHCIGLSTCIGSYCLSIIMAPQLQLMAI